MRLSLKAVVSICTSLSFFSGSIAFADGISSKDKVRTPIDTVQGIVYGPYQVIKKKVYTSRQHRNIWKIHTSVKRQAKIRERMAKKEEGFIRKESVKISNSNPGRQVDRLKLVKRGNERLKAECKTLHTHLRAVCQRDAQLKKSPEHVRLAFDKSH